MSEPLSERVFRAVFPDLRQRQIVDYLAPLNAALREYMIDTDDRIAAFLGQVGHESAGLTRWEENLNYRPERLHAIARSVSAASARIVTLLDAERVVAGGPEAIAEALYGGRDDLGNTEPGDGYKFRGRSPIQLTGRANYREMGEGLNVPLEKTPDLAATAPVGFRVAARYWATHGCNELADRGDLVRLTKRINGGIVGLSERGSLTQMARLALRAPAPVAEAATRTA